MNKYVLAFSGQGSQYAGMGEEFFYQNSKVKNLFKTASEIVNHDLIDECYSSSIEEFNNSHYSQTLIVVLEISIFISYFELLKNPPEYLSGHSLGEFSALVCSGALDFEEVIDFVHKREQLMYDNLLGYGSMLAIMGISKDCVEKICETFEKDDISISNYNSDFQFVVSGKTDIINNAKIIFEHNGANTLPINTNYPLHTKLMKKIQNHYDSLLSQLHKKDFNIPVISSFDGSLYNDKNLFRILSKQLVNPVRWDSVIDCIHKKNIYNFIEIGPQGTLRNLLLLNQLGINAYSINNRTDIDEIKNLLYFKHNELSNDNSLKIDFLQKCIIEIISTCNNNLDEAYYKKYVVCLYEKLNSMLDLIIKNKWEVSPEIMMYFFEHLLKVLDYKKINYYNKKDIINNIIFSSGYIELFKNYVEGVV